MRALDIKAETIEGILKGLLEIPSPVTFTDNIVRFICTWLDEIGAEYEITRRGAIRVNLTGRDNSPDRAVVAHVDTLGAQVKYLKDNGRLEVVPIGHWSSRFAEGARGTIFTDNGPIRGTILPLKASGHTFNEEVDTQPTNWQNVEMRVDMTVHNAEDLSSVGINVGDIIAIDPQPEFMPNGFVVSRHLDDKAGAAAMMAALDAILREKPELPVDCHFLFTISEEVGVGASAVLHGDVAELVAIDNGTQAPGQMSSEFGVTVAMGDQTGPFDYHLTHLLLGLCRDHNIRHQRDVFRYYRADAASALEAGNDIRTALLTFGIDASHGYERTHVDSLLQLAKLLTLYVQSERAVARDTIDLGPLKGFPDQPVDH